jgi:hypothetical protein
MLQVLFELYSTLFREERKKSASFDLKFWYTSWMIQTKLELQ